MRSGILIFIIILIYFVSCPLLGKSNGGENVAIKTIVNIELENGIPELIELGSNPVGAVGFNFKYTLAKSLFINRQLRFHLSIKKNSWFYIKGIKGLENIFWIAEPGDSISICMRNDGNFSFRGKGAKKLELIYKLKMITRELNKTTRPVQVLPTSIPEYFEWNNYYNKLLELTIPVIQDYEKQISLFVFLTIKSGFIDPIEEGRIEKFYTVSLANNKSDSARKNLCNIFDSTAYGKYALWLRTLSSLPVGRYEMARAEVYRKYQFDTSHDSLTSGIKRRFLIYEQGKRMYKGIAREHLLLDLLAIHTIKEYGLIPEVEQLLSKYYQEPGYPEYKNIVREFESNARMLQSGRNAPAFSLTDIKGNKISNDMLKGKVSLMDFWFTGCLGCIQTIPALRQVENTFSNDTNMVFLSVSVDADRAKWIRSIAQGKYTTGNGINLYTEGKGSHHAMIKAYNVLSYPTLHLVDGFGNIVQNPLPSPRANAGKDLTSLIQRELVLLKDGPYVFYEKDSISCFYIDGNSVSKQVFDFQNKRKLNVQSDEYRSGFDIMLKKELTIEPSEFPMPRKLLVLSDIEGNFGALKELLLAGGVIDTNFNWTYGDGHLVFDGDMLDRGYQVTESLWLLYSLEDKAKKAGGYVHFILGNHEIMNLNNDHRYVRSKYKKNALLLERTYSNLYSDQSELGKWLRTKNIMEKVGNLLIVHAGISKQVNNLSLSIQEINDLARQYYDRDSLANHSNNDNLSVLFNSRNGFSPFWNRSYYGGDSAKLSMSDVSITRKKFNVEKIITGHTIIGDNENYGKEITIHYEGQVINVDTHHAAGYSEALLIEKNNYYKIDKSGKKTSVF